MMAFEAMAPTELLKLAELLTRCERLPFERL